MAMTERQGGSDVRANITRAEETGEGSYELHGHKWFCSYPPCDVFLVLAQTPAGLSCFLVERGPGMEFQRLKDKLGTRSLPSAELEFRGAPARLLGEEGRGVQTIIRMVNHTRLDCMLGSVSVYRRGITEAIHHARHRSAFGTLLVDQPAIAALDVLRALEREPEAVAAFRSECDLARGGDRHLDAHLDMLKEHEPSEFGARRTVEQLALTLQASLLERHAPSTVADTYCASRLGNKSGRAYGTLPIGVAAAAIIDRALPPT